MKRLKTYQKFFESIGSPLLNLSDNVDDHLISKIQKEVQPGSKILEISCGNSTDSLKLKELGYEVICTEYNSDYVKNAQDLGLDCIQHDTKNEFPFSDSEFDLIYSRLGLHYFTEEELVSIFSELKRIGKRILITVKVMDDIKTGKVILTENKWKEIVSKFFNIKSFEVKEGQLYGSQTKWIEILGEKTDILKEGISEDFDSDFEDVKDILNDISDFEDVGYYALKDIGIHEEGRDDYLLLQGIKINIFPTKGEFFKINQNIKSTIQKLNNLYKDEYSILYHYLDGYKWTKFYVYNDERGLRDYDTVKMDGSGKFPAPKINKMQIVMNKSVKLDSFLESNQEIDIYDFANKLKGWNPYPPLSEVKRLSERFIGPGIYDRVEKMVDNIFDKLKDVDVYHIKDALYDVFDEFLEKSNRLHLCVLYCSPDNLKESIERRFRGSMGVKNDIDSSRTHIICHILLDMVNPTFSISYPSVEIRQTDEQIYVTDPKWNCVNFNIDNYEISKKEGQHIPVPFDYRKRQTFISPLDLDKLRKYNIEDFFECYKPGIYIQLYDSGHNYIKMPLKKIEQLFDENLPRILSEVEYEKILWEVPRENRQFDENSYELYDFTIKILLK